jgi:hypothetical protein
MEMALQTKLKLLVFFSENTWTQIYLTHDVFLNSAYKNFFGIQIYRMEKLFFLRKFPTVSHNFN